MKISSRSKEQLDWAIKKLKEVYGEITEHHGEEHDYLGMILTYELEKKRIILNMKRNAMSTLDEFEQSNQSKNLKQVNTPASNN